MEETLTELARSLRNYLGRSEFNPKRLEEAEERLDLIHRLERKYGGSIESALAFAADARKQLETISTASTRIAELETAEAPHWQNFPNMAWALSKKRKEAAGKMSQAIEVELDGPAYGVCPVWGGFQTRPDPLAYPWRMALASP